MADNQSAEKVKHRARKIVARFKKMKAEKKSWLPLLELCAEYVLPNSQGFNSKLQAGTSRTNQIFDDTAPKANELMTASFLGAMWPNGAKTFRYNMPYGMEDDEFDQDESEEVKLFYQWMTKTAVNYMDHPKAGLTPALEEYFRDQGAFGISGMHVDEDEDDYNVPLLYRALNAKSIYIDEGRNGFVNTIYIEKEYTIRQLVEEYGIDNISKEHKTEFLSSQECSTTVTVLQAIEPRMDADPYGFGVKNMPVASIHIDVKTEKIMRESGFLEMPAFVTRFMKALGEKYGRCPAMNAMPSILEANALGEAWILAVEKTLDPSLLVMDDSTMGGMTIDTSPGAINVVAVSGRLGSHKPIEPLFLVGDLNWTAARRTEIAEIIKGHFYEDRLTGLGKDERMQNPEVAIVNDLRGQSLNTVYSRQIAETFVPLIETTTAKLRRRGLLGVIKPEDTATGEPTEIEMKLRARGITPKYIPTAIVQRMLTGQEYYRIEFISPATKIMQSDELQGIEHLINSTLAIAPVNPSVLDIVDWDWTLRRVQELDGAPRETIVSIERLKKLRQQRAEMQQAAAQLEADRQQSETARNAGQAVASIAGAGQQSAAA